MLGKRGRAALFVYQQTYTHNGRKFQRRGLIANVTVQPFGNSPDGRGGIHPHEQTFSGPKEDRMKLMLATQAQLSPIFGLHSDPQNKVGPLLAQVIERNPPAQRGTTGNDGVLHEIWAVDDETRMAPFEQAFDGAHLFIADGHHRYTTALNYRNKLIEQKGALPADHPANYCLFVLVAMQDPGLIVLPTHRVLGGMKDWSLARFTEASRGLLDIKPFGHGTIGELEAALPKAGPHAMGLYAPGEAQKLSIVTTTQPDPLANLFSSRTPAWRQLDVAIIQHLIVEQICQRHFTENGTAVQWKFPHTLEEVERDTQSSAGSVGYQMGLIVQPTPLESVRLVSEAGELMPQKSTFFYPKLATGLVVNPLD